jgi:phosphoribosylaminoimidazolecarboxamide formyltransferase/IMP cyclohydrolase
MRAIISVADRTNLVELARELLALEVEIFTPNETLYVLQEEEISVRSIGDLIPHSAILKDGDQLLQQWIFSAVLARRGYKQHEQDLARHRISPIDLVVVNLVPFSELTAHPEAALTEMLEQVDVGRAALLHAAARNFQDVTVLVHPQDYMPVIQEWREQGEVSQETRHRLAVTALQYSACYDSRIAEYLAAPLGERFPEELALALTRIQPLRYGENPHQQASLYRWAHVTTAPRLPTVANATILQHGKELSYNNLLDLDAALTTVQSFTAPTVAIIKHTSPCGVACDDSLPEAHRKAYMGDSVSAYGGIIGCNRSIDEATALEISQLFYEAIIAPDFTPAALEILHTKKNLRLLATHCPIDPRAINTHLLMAGPLEARSISGGLLVQTPDFVGDGEAIYRVVSDREPTLEEVTDLMFAWKVVRCVRSNAIVLAHKLTVVGVGAGQMNRVTSVHLAVAKAGATRARGSVLASDAFFPFPDGVEAAARAGVTALIQPGGSLRDDEAIEMANRYALAMIFTGKRHFRH